MKYKGPLLFRPSYVVLCTFLRQLHFQDRRSQQFALGIDPQRLACTTGQRIVQHKIQGSDTRQLKSFDARSTERAEVLRNPLGGKLAPEPFETLGRIRHHTNVGMIPLVAAPCMGELFELHAVTPMTS